MDLGAFSISLAVQDLAKSQAFYEKLGFRKSGGKGGYAILVNDAGAVIGLFEKMFEKNILTFNPGLTNDPERISNFSGLESFTDVRDIQAKLESEGIKFDVKADPESEGVASFIITDPDGNPILVDQHFPRPKG